ncbi:MAG: hypothetical protein NC904_06530, partial [Candidatus Omnitrophica bacterium]|nr:hypothetical protein [Candidatus Omnitrophota bacterium]
GLVSPIYAGRLPLGLDKPGDIIPQGSSWKIMRQHTKLSDYPTQFIIDLNELKTSVEKRALEISKEYEEIVTSLTAEIEKLKSDMKKEIQNEVKLYEARIVMLRNYI